jgi:hypothetical protein
VDELLSFEEKERDRGKIAAEEHVWQEPVQRAFYEIDARDFNASLMIPVRWQPAAKIALNALYEGNGSGARSNSVEHVQVMEPLGSPARAGAVRRRATSPPARRA